MVKKVLVVSKTETFTIKGLEMKLKGVGAEAVFAELKVKTLDDNIEKTDLTILYTDEDIAQVTDALVYIKDHCSEANRKVIVIGTKTEYEVVQKVISRDILLDFFERPLVMEKLLTAVENHLSAENQAAKRKSILIVDDDVQYMSMIMDWLKENYRVSMANSGMNAITWLATNHADLILLDYEMPITPGPQVLEMLKSNPETANIPVMFLTGNSDRDSIVKVVSLGPVDYLLKTIDRKGLNEKLWNYFVQADMKK
ncbi:MAG: response regulator [Lachnospiraceae bacterium]|nr:response regulator [Lachnospiraceae bacterium]